MDIAIIEAEKSIEKLASGIEERAIQAENITKTMTFPNPGMYSQADEIYNELHQSWSAWEKERKKFTEPLNEVLSKINGVFQPKIKWVDGLKKKLKGCMDAYVTEEMMWKRAEQAKIEAEDRKKAEAEQKRIADMLKQEGMDKIAESMLKEPVIVPKQEIETAFDSGMSTVKTTWKAEITDLKKFLHAVADGAIPLNLVTVNTAELDRLAAFFKGNVSYPGVACKEVASVGARR